MKKNLAILFSSLLLCASAQAEEPKAPKEAKTGGASKAQPEPVAPSGDYRGVTPSSGIPPSPKVPPKGYQYMTWPGFRVTETHSEIFLQLTGPVTHTSRRKGNRLEITLKKTKAYLRNNLRPVNTQHFPGPVRGFRIKPVPGGNLRLTVDLRRGVDPEIAVSQSKNYSFLTVRFPRQAVAE
jgi:hypothetical protein